MIIEKYTQLRLAHQFGRINVIDIHSRYRKISTQYIEGVKYEL